MRWDGQAGLHAVSLQAADVGGGAAGGPLLLLPCGAVPHWLLLTWPQPAPAAAAAGSQTLQGEAVGFETEATAIMDTMAYIRPDIYTLVG